MLRQPGKPIQIYDIPELSKDAFEKAFTPSNISSGFRRTGIYPFNENTFDNDDFLGAFVTDRDYENSQIETSLSLTNEPANQIEKESEPATNLTASCSKEPDKEILTPEKILPFPKAAARIKKCVGRKSGKSRIITETPEKNQIEEQHLKKIRRTELKKLKTTKRKLKLSNKKDSSSDESSYDEMALCKDSSSELDFTSDDECCLVDTNNKIYQKGDFLLVKLKVENKEIFVHYIGRVIHVTSSDLTLTYLRKSSKRNEFYFPNEEDKDTVSLAQIIRKLNPPKCQGSRKRKGKFLSFAENLSMYTNLR